MTNSSDTEALNDNDDLEYLEFKFWVKAPIVPVNYINIGKSFMFQFMHYINIYKNTPYIQ